MNQALKPILAVAVGVAVHTAHVDSAPGVGDDAPPNVILDRATTAIRSARVDLS